MGWGRFGGMTSPIVAGFLISADNLALVWGLMAVLSLVLIFLPTYVTDVATSHGLASSASSNVPIVVYGVVLILVMMLFPSGIQGGIRRLLINPAPFHALRRHEPASEHQKEGTT